VKTGCCQRLGDAIPRLDDRNNQIQQTIIIQQG
jgi:hypothetical protein